MGGVKKTARFVIGRFLLLPGVPVSRLYPDRSNHKGSLLRKKEDNNQDDDNFENWCEIHFDILSQSAPLKTAIKKPPVVGAACVSFAGVCAYFALTAAIPTGTWSLRIRTEIITTRMRVKSTVFISCISPDYRPFPG